MMKELLPLIEKIKEEVKEGIEGKKIKHLMTRAIVFSTEFISPGAVNFLYFAGKELGRRAVAPNLKKFPEGVKEIPKALEAIGYENVKIIDERTVRINGCFCKGIPQIGVPICYFEAGLIAGIYEGITEKRAAAKEVKCSGTGEDFCEFKVVIE